MGTFLDFLRRHSVGLLALCVALGGTGAYAADKIGQGKIAASAVRSKHIKDKQVRPSDLAPQSRVMFGHVDSDGDLRYGRGIADTERISAGRYEITFKRNVRRCIPFANAGVHLDESTVSRANYVASANVSGSERPKVLTVTLWRSIRDTSGAENGAFFVGVLC